MSRWLILSAFVLTLFCLLRAEEIIVTINPDQTVLTSTFHIGATHTHGFWEFGNSDAVQRARNLLVDGLALQNQHIMGWGVGNPEPSSGVYNWGDLDRRVDLMRSLEAPMFITFCQAPGWMKGAGDWEMEQEVLDEYVDDFADLCGRIAARYPDVTYFQVWNELKGYWSSALNNWDYVRYTALYNAVYTAVKSARPDALVGGPYIVIQGDGAVEIGKRGRDTHVPLDSRDRTFLNYWLKNKIGADFICMDYGLIDYHDTNTYTHDEQMQLTRFFGVWISDIRAMTDLPIVISEFYGGSDESDPEFTGANHASCYLHALMNGASVALQWNPEQGELDNFLFTDTDATDGGQPTAHYHAVKAINDFFYAGTDIVASTSSSAWLEVLASVDKTMLINKRDETVTAVVNGERVDLNRYEIRVMDTPAAASVNAGEQVESSRMQIDYAAGPAIHLTAARSTTVSVQIHNLLGQRVQQFSRPVLAGAATVIDISAETARLPKGVYFLHVNGLEKPLVQQMTIK
ncbi:hypothetical protein JXA02_11900 [candidate division KSB1 bacterium]|nr:hypothetical protein [candidate division KSB1 bacterium]RQW01987.1 MAG: hypothetical protein EH222_14250 [candidate division KSB1 bacterium]